MKCAVAIMLAAILALTNGGVLAAQEREPITFAGDVFDVTGAGVLELGDVDPVLAPYVKIFRDQPIMAKLTLEATVDPASMVIDCRTTTSEGLAEAGRQLCIHAKAKGRFRAFAFLKLDYARANYRVRINLNAKPAEGGSAFYAFSGDYPSFDRRAIVFGDGVIPAEDQRLANEDVTVAPIDYPSAALRNEIEGRVVVAVEFNAAGNPTSCRPLRSSHTARLAYDTCAAAMRAVRLRQPPDARPFVLAVVWNIP